MTGLRKALLAITTFTTLSIATMAPANEALAQQLCLIRDDAIAQLGKEYGEAIAARGITRDGKGMVELLTSENGSWTLVITDVNGRSCIVGAGEAWNSVQIPRGQPS